MGNKAPDVLTHPPSPLTALSLGEMHQLRWTMVARCSKCGLAMRTNLAALVRLHGPDAIWWGHETACPGLECVGGRLSYSVQSIPGGSWVSMKTKPDPQLVQTWRTKRAGGFRGPR
jgi:hypothetical protein